MRIKRIAGMLFSVVFISSSLALASCGDADGDGNTPMKDNDNDYITDGMNDVKDDITGGIRNRKRQVPENDISKDAPDSANINI